MIITTSISESERLTEKAVSIGLRHKLLYVPRQGRSLQTLYDNYDTQVFVVNARHGISFYEKGKQEAFFHPNMAFLRIQNLKKGGKDSLLEVCGLYPDMSFLDATLGLASDALTVSYVLGTDGVCTGVEKSKVIYVIVKEGLAIFAEQCTELREVIRRIKIHNCDNIDYLKTCRPNEYDVVYFDFMFSEPIAASKGIQIIRDFAEKDKFTPLCFEEAKRVSRGSIVVKCDYNDMKRLTNMGFQLKKENSRKSFFYMEYKKAGTVLRNFVPSV